MITTIFCLWCRHNKYWNWLHDLNWVMDNKVINALDKEEEIMHERDEALTFQDNILYWNLQIKNLLQGDNYQRVHSLTQTWQEANQHLELTSTSWNYKSNHMTATPWNHWHFGIALVMQHTTILIYIILTRWISEVHDNWRFSTCNLGTTDHVIILRHSNWNAARSLW